MQLLLPLIPEGSSRINDNVSVVRDKDCWTYYAGIFPICSHEADDHAHFRFTLAQFVIAGTCHPCELMSVFGIGKNKVLRAARQLRERGAGSFFNRRSGRRGGTVLTREKLLSAQRLLDQGAGRGETAELLGVARDTLRKAINDGRLQDPPSPLPPSVTLGERNRMDMDAATGMGTACTRTLDRLYSSIGLGGVAAVDLKPASDVLNGGVLCALPALLMNGLLSGIDKLGAASGYYSTEHVLLSLAIIFLCRIKSVEQLRKYSSGEFGRLIGLDRIPEARCMRKKIDDIAGDDGAAEWSAFLSRRWMAEMSEPAGFLYVDGHVKVYSGGNKLPRRFVSRERLCLRGISSYWVNDALGRPFFFIEKQIDAGLIQALEEDIIPRLLAEVPGQPTEEELAADPILYRFVIVFDREGCSHELFGRLWNKYRIACLTYRKNCRDTWPDEEFSTFEAAMPDGELVEMTLAERGSIMGKNNPIWVKEVRKLTESGHQTAMVTTAKSLITETVAPAMFTRWCQENFFGYATKNFPIDILTQYGGESFPGTEKVVNPKWRKLDRLRNSAKSKLARRQAKFLEMDSRLSADPNHSGHPKWIERKSKLLETIEALQADIAELAEQRNAEARHIRWDQLDEEDKFMRMPQSRRLLVNTLAMIAYRAETAMATLMRGKTGIHFSQARSILQALFIRPADILPDKDAETLDICVHGASTHSENLKLIALFEELNATETVFPLTSLKMVFKLVHSTE